jgi:hypothetical protein
MCQFFSKSLNFFLTKKGKQYVGKFENGELKGKKKRVDKVFILSNFRINFDQLKNFIFLVSKLYIIVFGKNKSILVWKIADPMKG